MEESPEQWRLARKSIQAMASVFCWRSVGRSKTGGLCFFFPVVSSTCLHMLYLFLGCFFKMLEISQHALDKCFLF